MTGELKDKVLEIIGSSENSFGEVQEATEMTVKVKLNTEKARKLGVRPSIGDFILLEAEEEHPIAVVFSQEVRSNIPLTEHVGVKRSEREKIYYEPPATILNALIVGYFDAARGEFRMGLPGESTLPDDQAFYLSGLEEAVSKLHVEGSILKLPYLPKFIELAREKEVVKVFLRKISESVGKSGFSKEDLVDAVLNSFRYEGQVSRRVNDVLDVLQLVEEVWVYG